MGLVTTKEMLKKAYEGGENRAELQEYSKTLCNYSGEMNEVYKKYLDDAFLALVRTIAQGKYQLFTDKNKDTREFTPVSLEFLNKNI